MNRMYSEFESSAHIIDVALSKILTRYRKLSHIQMNNGNQLEARRWIKQEGIINLFIIMNNKKIKAQVDRFENGIYYLTLATGQEVSISHIVMHHDVDFPATMMDAGQLKINSEVSLYKAGEDRWYPDHSAYVCRNSPSSRILGQGFPATKLMQLPVLPRYTKETVSMLLDRDDIQREKLIDYFHSLINNREDAMTTIYHDLGITPIPRESETVEHKSSLIYSASSADQGMVLTKAILSFANSHGGRLYIGINDNLEICGIENEVVSLDAAELKLRNQIRSHCNSDTILSLISFEWYRCENHLLLIVNVKAANQPLFINGNSLYIRSGNSSIKLNDSDLIHFIQTRNLTA